MKKYLLGMALVIAFSIAACAEVSGGSGAKRDRTSRRAAGLYVPQTPAHGEKWIPGVHYNVLLPPLVRSAASTKVELLELSMYTTFAAPDEFRELLKQWLRAHESTVSYIRQPSVAGGMPHARIQARIFFAFESLGRSDLHERMDAWVKDPARNSTYHNIWAPDENAILRLTSIFAGENGVERSAFERAYHSADVDERLRKAVLLTDQCAVDGTPTFVIDRRFSVSIQRLSYPDFAVNPDGNLTHVQFERLIQLIDYLTNAEMGRLRRSGDYVGATLGDRRRNLGPRGV